jgi:hypothetical protein
MQIDERVEQFKNALRSIRESRVGHSNTTVDTDSQSEKQFSPSVSTEEGMQITM